MTKENKNNIVFTCPEHSDEMYFNIKKIEKQPKMRGHVYVRFQEMGKVEKMWVRITQGNQKAGKGTIDNKPYIIKSLRYKTLVSFKTDKRGITNGKACQ